MQAHYSIWWFWKKVHSGFKKMVFSHFTEYYENAYYPQYECNIPLLEQAAITATSSLRERGPENARLNGKKIY